MNKTELTARVAQITGYSIDKCALAMDALEDVSGGVVIGRMKGEQLEESDAVDVVAQKTGFSEEECKTLLTAFEQAMGESLSHTFRFFRRKKD